MRCIKIINMFIIQRYTKFIYMRYNLAGRTDVHGKSYTKSIIIYSTLCALRLFCIKLFIYDKYNILDFNILIQVFCNMHLFAVNVFIMFIFALFQFGNSNFGSKARQLSVKCNLGLDLT